MLSTIAQLCRLTFNFFIPKCPHIFSSLLPLHLGALLEWSVLLRLGDSFSEIMRIRRTLVVSHTATPCLASGVLFHRRPQGAPMLWTIFAVLLILWLLGFSFHIAAASFTFCW